MGKITWLEKNGFDRYSEDTYINIEPDTYSIKEKLKADGYKYNPVLGWHTAYPNKEYAHIKINFNEVCEWSDLEVPLTLTEAALGCKKEIPTLYGNVKINISAGTNSGDKQRIKGSGVDNKYRKHKGDMYLVFKVYTPKKLSRDQKAILDELSDTNLETEEIKQFNKFTKKNDN